MPLALDHVNLYLLEDGDGWTLVDCGLADPGTRAVWERLLATRLNGRPITRIIVTHFHPDHVGMAGWLEERTGAGLWMSRVEWLMARSIWLDTESDRSPQMREFYRRAGFDAHDIQAQCELGNDYRGLVTPIPVSYSRITPQTGFRIGDRLWQPVFGSGHSPDHVALYCESDRVLLGGDMLLPRITPIIAVWWQEPDADPLSDYLEFSRIARRGGRRRAGAAGPQPAVPRAADPDCRSGPPPRGASRDDAGCLQRAGHRIGGDAGAVSA